MIYRETNNIESIVVSPLDNVPSTRHVELLKCGDIPVFAVWMNDEKDDWFWEFEMYTPSDYERVKMRIFDAIFECDTMPELARALDAIFKNGFEDILITNEDECEGCNCNECNKYMH